MLIGTVFCFSLETGLDHVATRCDEASHKVKMFSSTVLVPRSNQLCFLSTCHAWYSGSSEADGAIKGLDLLETITRNTAQNPKEETGFGADIPDQLQRKVNNYRWGIEN